ncbi:hypothetical protein EYC98_21450 [Halieaceae bacterium IMCC14734]|uniref:Outer membrane protein beta-barrel domain-containing protein n=1 Tax=Candidatus Litorirhabdus singularis TaxID=2518993 RepID=A0ABT3TN41_9GAMM|nr:hypothetical protein [Candidatus Litorirhabdus singularis]MCX2983434.1 hypothetical protein [Candidatus Litorirhabdus singularis]
MTASFSLSAEEQWSFNLSPYIWFAGFEGDVATIEGLPPVNVDISPSDAIDDTETSFMFISEAKKGKQGVYLDFYYSDMTSEEPIVELEDTTIQSGTKTTMATVGYTYEVFSNQNTVLEAMAGARWWQIDSTLTLRGPLPDLNISADKKESWTDPFIGIKGKSSFPGSNFYVAGGVGYGGFGINADSFYDLTANLGYQWTESIATAVGYRLYDLDYDESGFKYDVKQQGWQVGLTWQF